MTSDDELEELRRVAFGRASTADERSAAARALSSLAAAEAAAESKRTGRERAGQERARHERATRDTARGEALADSARGEALADAAGEAAAATAVGATEVVSGGVASGGASAAEERRGAAYSVAAVGPAAPPKHGLRPLWLVPIVLASLAIGAIAGNAVVGPRNGPTASASPLAAPGGSPAPEEAAGLGDLHAVDRLFEREQTEQDNYPDTDLAASLRVSTLRYLGGEQDGAQAWAGTTSDGQICLLAINVGQGAGTCSTREDFAQGGISFGINAYTIAWDGLHTAISPPTVYFG